MSPTQQPAAPSPGGRRKQENPSRRRFKWTRRLAFFCGWLVLMAACLAALLVGLVWVGMNNATQFANFARQHFAADYPIEIGSVSFPQSGVIELRDLTLDLPESGNRAAAVELVRLRYDPSNLFGPRARSLLIENPDLTLNDELLALFAPETPDPNAPPPNFNWIKIDELKIVNGKVDLDLGGIPKGSWAIDLEAADIDLSREGRLVSAHPQFITLRNLRVEDPGGDIETPLAKIDELSASIRLNKDLVSGAVATLHLTRPVVRYTPELIAALQPPQRDPTAPQTAPQTAAATQPATAPMRWSLDEIVLDDGFFAMSGFYDSPDISFHHTGKFTGLTWSSDTGLSWPGWQEASITDVRVDARALPRPAGESSDPNSGLLTSASRIDIAGFPDKFFAHGWIDQITSREPVIHISEERLRRFLTAAPDDKNKLLLSPSGGDTDIKDPDPKPEAGAYIIRVRHLDVADAKVTAEAAGFLKGLPESTFTLNLRSAKNQPDPDSDVHYELSITDLHVHPTNNPTGSIVTGDRILTEFSAAGIQRDQRIDSVAVSGVKVRLGQEVQDIIAELGEDGGEPAPVAPAAPDPQPEAAPAAAATDATPAGWKLGRLELDETSFVLEDFIPGLPYLPLALKKTILKEIPLSGGERGEPRMHEVELSDLEIAAPYNSLLPVARLNSIFIKFTIPGLLRNEIDSVIIVSPEIFLGEPLFWYVDYYQKFASHVPAQGNGEPTEKLAVAATTPDPCAGEADATGEPAGEGEIPEVEDILKNTEISGWTIRTIKAETGSLIVAPKGYRIWKDPFPFSGETNLAEGKIRLDLTVPRADYLFEKLKLQLRGLNGAAYFNYPRDENRKNFVQVFSLPTLIYGDYRADDIYLSVTYNGKLIHGEFGGWAYDGYVNGEFNINIDQTYTWNAWVAGTGLMLSPLTAALSPGNVTLTGKVNAVIVANGAGLVPELITGTLDTIGPCHMHITKLDETLESLQVAKPGAAPNIWEAFLDPLNQAISVAGIEAFRHYNFTAGKAELGLVGRDGTANIVLDGPDGTRQVDFHFYDKRDPAKPSEITE